MFYIYVCAFSNVFSPFDYVRNLAIGLAVSGY